MSRTSTVTIRDAQITSVKVLHSNFFFTMALARRQTSRSRPARRCHRINKSRYKHARYPNKSHEVATSRVAPHRTAPRAGRRGGDRIDPALRTTTDTDRFSQ